MKLKTRWPGALAMVALCGFGWGNVAQARPKWSGNLTTKASSFNDFMRRQVGKTVDLDVVFRAGKYDSGAEPYTSLGGATGPIFMVGGSSYQVENGGNEYNWRTLMGYNKDRRQLVGTFGVSGGRKSAEDSGYIYDLRWRPSFKRDVKVFVEDEKGRILLRSSGITLRGSHIQVPSAAYKVLGFDVRRDIENGKVTVGTPGRSGEKGADTTTFDVVYNSVTYLPPKYGEKKLFEDFRPPVALLQNGEFFIAPSLVQRRFPTKISSKWDAKNRTMRLRRTQKFMDEITAIFSHT